MNYFVSSGRESIPMKFKALTAVLLLICLDLPGTALVAGASKGESEGLSLSPVQKPWTGDYDGMVKRRQLRVLVVNSKTFYFVDKGTQRGTAYDLFKALETDINKSLKTKHVQVHVTFVPVARDKLIPYLVEGRGDIAASNLTITAERQKSVDFTEPVYTGVRELVITGPRSPKLAGLEDLAGQEIFVRKSSSYYQSLLQLNEDLKKKGKSQAILKAAPEELEDEDLLEMLNAGLVKIVIVDSHKADFWKQIFNDIQVHPNLALRSQGEIGWAMRQNSPQLKAMLNEFIKTHRAGTAFGNELLRRYLKDVKYVKSATSEEELKKFRELVSYFKKYSSEYGLDPFLVVAQGYQESRLDPSARSQVGALGVMQVMPATGKQMNVGDVHQTESNIHAGTKYIRFMIDQYYKNEPMTDLDKGLFAFASYNAGPNRLQQLRKEAAKRGLDPNRWFNNVELVVADKIGRETVQYVSNIYKYYVAYRLLNEEEEAREQARKRLGK
jgi:membrane-bound lytic murein transglycosylase MltF